MNNYYDTKFKRLIDDLEYTNSNALIEIVHLYLDNKPKKLKKEKVSQSKRDELFWNSKSLQEHKREFAALETYSLALSKNFKSEFLYQIDILKYSAITFPLAMKQAIKYSKIFLEKDNKNYTQLKEVLNKTEFEECFKICDGIAKYYNSLTQDVKAKEKLLMDYGYVDLLLIISLSSLKYTLNNANNPSYFSIYSMVLTKLVQDRISKKDRRKKAIDQTHIEEKIIKYFRQNIHNNVAPEEYELFEEIFKAYEALVFFEQNEFYTFLYDDNYKFTLLQEKITLCPIDMNKHINTAIHSEKLQGMFKYYEEEAVIVLADKFKKEYNGKQENYDMNFFQELSVYQTHFIMSEIFGLDKNVFIDDNKTLNIFHLIYEGHAFSSLYAFEFLKPYLPILQKYGMENWWQAHKDIIVHSMMTHRKNRMPLIYKTKNKVVSEIKGNQQIDFGEKIIDFWSHDLNAEKNNSIKYPSFFEKPFIKIDDFVFVFPWLMSFSGTSPMTFINSLLRVHTNRMELLEDGKKNNVRKDEVCRSEKNLAELFKKLDFIVEDGYTHSKEAADYGVEDMDIIASKDGHLFILEVG